MRNSPSRRTRSWRSNKLTAAIGWATPPGVLAAAFVTCLSACGAGTGTSASAPSPSTRSTTSATAPTDKRAKEVGGYVRSDGDDDGDDGSYPPGDDDKDLLSRYRRAGPSETKTIAALVRSYYAASLAARGQRACALLSGGIASGLASADSNPQSQSRTCAAAMSALLAQQHAHLTAENPATMTVVAVYVRGTQGLAVVGFRSSPRSELLVRREGGQWRIDALFDSLMT